MSERASAVPDTPARVLLVDDDAGLLRLLSIRLNAQGYQVRTAGDGLQALGQIDTFHPQVVITDLRMEGMDGMALFQALQEYNPTLPVIILTAHGTIPDAVAAAQRGVFGYLTKPFDSQALMNKVAEAIHVGGQGNVDQADIATDGDSLIYRSAVMQRLTQEAQLVARSDSSVLIQGESGTGKELLAQSIHDASARAENPFVAVNCSAIPDQLYESELFGHARGAFTGATRDHDGLFRAAEHGTLFLDEIGDMPLGLQAKLLRALQEKAVRPVGSTRSLPIDVRVISATHRNLERAVASAEFREDLFYRLNVVMLEMPALRERREDIPLLCNHFLAQEAERNHKRMRGFSTEAMELLVAAPWPGNVRQLRNVVEHCVVLAPVPLVTEDLVRKALRDKADDLVPLAEAKERFEHGYLVKLLRITNGNVTQAARLAQRNRSEFYKLLRRHRLQPELFRDEETD
jgi:two-component system, NtrC family, response regulator GlrR